MPDWIYLTIIAVMSVAMAIDWARRKISDLRAELWMYRRELEALHGKVYHEEINWQDRAPFRRGGFPVPWD